MITVTLSLVVLRLIHSLVRNHRIDSTSQVQAYYHYHKAFNVKQFILHLSTTHGEDLSKFASYPAYLTGSNKIFYLHEHYKSKVWADVERTGFADDSIFSNSLQTDISTQADSSHTYGQCDGNTVPSLSSTR